VSQTLTTILCLNRLQVMWGQVLFLDILARVNEIWRDQDQQDSNFSNLPPKNLSRMTHY
jgi:hypothetical protein